MPRLGHKKSRLGCRQCKARHVKCDELRPCSNCARHGVACSLNTWDPAQQPPPPSTTTASSSSAPQRPPSSASNQVNPSGIPSPPQRIEHGGSQPHDSPNLGKTAASASTKSEASSPASSPDTYPFLTRFIHRAELTQADLWLRDLELLHHWTVEAYDTLSQRDDMRHCWRVEGPKHAVGHPFFMHEILAFAALHKASQCPDLQAQFYSFGIHHQDMAIRGIRERIANILPQDAAALVATSTLLTLSVFASTGFEATFPEMADSHCPIESILNIFSLMQGMVNVVAVASRSVFDSFIGPIFKPNNEPTASQPMLEELMWRSAVIKKFIEDRTDLPDHEKRIYLKAIDNLEPTLQNAQRPNVDNRELRFLFFWPLHLDQDYLNLVRQKHSGALAVLMYYTTILFAADARYWYLKGWGKNLMTACSGYLGPDWAPAVQWPRNFLNDRSLPSMFVNLLQNKQAILASGQEAKAESPAEVPLRHIAAHPNQQQYTPSPTGQSMSYSPQHGSAGQHTPDYKPT